MLINGFIEKHDFYSLIENKLKELRITEKDYPINSIKLAEIYKDKLTIEYRKFPSYSMCGILYKGRNISSMCLNELRSEKGRNFDCMHELIHFWFHPWGDNLCIDNNFVRQNNTLEWQANEGAAAALMPPELFFKMFMALKGDIKDLSNYFFVGEKAVAYRIKNLGLTDINFNLLRVFGRKARYHCRICGNLDISYRDHYCSICGEDIAIAFSKGIYWIEYDNEVDLGLFGKAAVCPICGNQALPKYEYNCNICGTGTLQECTDNRDSKGRMVEAGCRMQPKSYARYCRSCGHETSFYRIGALKDWYKEMAEKLKRR